MWATRAGNVFTTHTPVAAGFDRFPPSMLASYPRRGRATIVQVTEIAALGLEDAHGTGGPFNTAYLAMRGAVPNFGVSRLHGPVCRADFPAVYPRWPRQEVPVDHVTNGVHVPTWDSADGRPDLDGGLRQGSLASRASGHADIASDGRAEKRSGRCAAQPARRWCATCATRLTAQLRLRGRPARDRGSRRDRARSQRAHPRFRAPLHRLQAARSAAARSRSPRAAAAATSAARCTRLAGKAHPADEAGKPMIQDWIAFARRAAPPPAGGVPRGLRHLAGAGAGPGRRRLDQHAAAAMGGLWHQRHEGAGQRRPQLFDPRRLVGRGLRTRLGWRSATARRRGARSTRRCRRLYDLIEHQIVPRILRS